MDTGLSPGTPLRVEHPVYMLVKAANVSPSPSDPLLRWETQEKPQAPSFRPVQLQSLQPGGE